MIQWSPDTNKDAWYRYDEAQVNVDARSTIATATSTPGGLRILGFSLTHVSGAGCSLYGDFAVLPTRRSAVLKPRRELRARESKPPTPFPSIMRPRKPTPATTL